MRCAWSSAPRAFCQPREPPEQNLPPPPFAFHLFSFAVVVVVVVFGLRPCCARKTKREARDPATTAAEVTPSERCQILLYENTTSLRGERTTRLLEPKPEHHSERSDKIRIAGSGGGGLNGRPGGPGPTASLPAAARSGGGSQEVALFIEGAGKRVSGEEGVGSRSGSGRGNEGEGGGRRGDEARGKGEELLAAAEVVWRISEMARKVLEGELERRGEALAAAERVNKEAVQKAYSQVSKVVSWLLLVD